MGVKVIGESGIGYPVRDNSAREIKQGEKRWNLKEGSIETGVFDNVNIVDGSDTFKLLRNNTGASIPKGKVLMASGTLGTSGRILGSLSDGSVTNAIRNVGITKHNVTNTNDVVTITNGKIDKLDTTGSSVGEGWLDGTILYISPNGSGNLTSIVPTTGQLKMAVAFVIKAHATNGSIEVRMTGIDENHIRNGLMTGDVVLGTSDSGTVDIKSGGVSRLLLDNYGVKNQGEYLSPFSGFKNLIVNGDFSVWSRGTSFSFTSGQYVADRWFADNGGSGAVNVMKHNLDSSPNTMLMTCNANNTFINLYHNLETSTVKKLRGKTLTFSCKMMVSATHTGTFQFSARYSTISDTRTVQGTSITNKGITATTTNSKFTMTFTVPMDAQGLRIDIENTVVQTNGAMYQIQEVQLEIGNVATPFEQRFYNLEKALCGEPSDNDAITGSVSFNQSYQKGFKNYLLNGAFDIWQRGTTFTNINGYTADRWKVNRYSSLLNTAVLGVESNAPYGIQNYIRLGFNNGGTGALYMNQVLESINSRHLRGKFVTLSFYARGSIAFDIYSVITFSTASQGATADQSSNYKEFNTVYGTVNGKLHTLSTSWVRYSQTVFIPNDTVQVMVSFGDQIYSDNRTMDFSNIQLEEGTMATPFEHRPYPLELMMCQRYYETGTGYIVSYANSGTAIQRGNVYFKTNKRTVPTFAVGGASGTATSPTPALAFTDMGVVSIASSGAGQDCSFIYTASAEI